MSKKIDNITQLTDKRAQPRYKTDFVAKVKISTGETLNAVVTNISLSGLQLTGGQDLPFKLFADRHQQDNQATFLNVHFCVPTSTRTSVEISVDCQSVYIRRLTKDQSIVGCQFCNFNHQTEKDLADYITHFGDPL